MAEAARYLFDRIFDDTSKGLDSKQSADALLLTQEWERKIEDARQAAFDAGAAETLAGIESETRDQVNALLQSAQQLLSSVEGECRAIRRNAIELATTTATQLAQELTKRLPTAQLESLVAEALEHMGDAPHIALTVNDAHAQSIQEAVTSIAAERGFTGKIIVLGDPETKVGDCSLQWADGGILLDQDKARNMIAGIVKRHLDSLPCDTLAPPGATDPADAPPAGEQPETDIEPNMKTTSGDLT